MRVAMLVSDDAVWALGLAAAWAGAGDTVTAVLLDRAAALVRTGHADGGDLRAAQAAGVHVAVHDDALRRRGLSVAALPADVKPTDLDEVADLVTDGSDKAVWL
jgi:hypothetical protein